VKSLKPQLSVLTGDVTTFLCIAVLEEVFVVAFFVFTDMKLDRLPLALRSGAKVHELREAFGSDHRASIA